MPKNKIDDLRNHLFETLESLKDDEKPMDIERARAVADVARVIVDSAKVEVRFLEVTGALKSTNFLPSEDGGEPKQITVGARVTPIQSRRARA
jgi:hypothetical protein